MRSNNSRLAVLFILHVIGITSIFASGRPKPTRSPTIPMLMHSNDTSSSPIAGLQTYHVPPPDPWTYVGPRGRYKFSNYHNPSIRLGWLATFLLTCMGDVFDATATQGFKPDQPYPDGLYDCHLRYLFPSGSLRVFALEMTKVKAPGWSMTFSDVADDLEALWYAALWFDGRSAGFPEMDFEVYRSGQQSSFGENGRFFLACRGRFRFGQGVTANMSHM